MFDSIDEAQAQLDGWVWHYNHERPHQAIGRVPPFEQFRLATPKRGPVEVGPEPVGDGRRPRPSPKRVTAASVTRKVDGSGNVCFAGTSYRVGNKFRRRQVQVAVVADTVEISIGEELIRSHPVKHDRTREHGALANPGGRPHRVNAV